MPQERETLDFDILFVGAGVANLTASIHLQRLINRYNESTTTALEPSIAIIDKGRYAGAHLLSGALLDPKALVEFFPDFQEKGCPIEATVAKETIWYLTAKRKFPIPFIPASFSNKTSLMVSLSRLGAWLAEQAEALGIQLFDSTAAVAPSLEEGRVTGVYTDDKGLDKQGNPKANYELGLLLKSKVTVVGEGAAGSLTRQLATHFPSLHGTVAQRYETGVKETWRIPEGHLQAGEVYHTFGYPLEQEQYGGGWLYAFSPTLVSLGFVSSPHSSNPYCDPHENLQRFKQHPLISPLLDGGTLLESGARTITSGGFDAMPQIYGDGFLLTGESAGMVDMQRHKGIHLAMKSGIMAAETLFDCLVANNFSIEQLQRYDERFRASWAYQELYAARNYRQAFDKGLYSGLMAAGIKLNIPEFSFPLKTSATKKSSVAVTKSTTFHGDGKRTFTKATSLFHSHVQHEENQPCHLHINPEDIATICLTTCTAEYGNPCQYFCPAEVYEIIAEPTRALKLNPSNCLHCKTCDVADPYGIITWTPPEGGGGPGYKMG